jgi:hypothetical protein
MIREAAKAFARQIPAIDALIRQRDDLLREVTALRSCNAHRYDLGLVNRKMSPKESMPGDNY